MRPGGRATGRGLLPAAVAALVAAGSGLVPAQAAEGPPFPRLANVYLHGSVDTRDIESLARWDVLVLDSVWSDAQLEQLRQYNADVRTYFYLCAYCIAVPPQASDVWRTTNYTYAQTYDLWWRNADGSIASDWPGTNMINVTDVALGGPAGNWRTFYKGRVESLVNSRRMLDGVFFDNFWKSIAWQQGGQVQLDSDCSPRRYPAGCNGGMDSPAYLDTLWNRALRDVARDMRSRFDRIESERGDRPLAILSNGSTDYFPWLNGTMYENFPYEHGAADRGNPHDYNWSTQMLAEPGGYLVAPFRQQPYGASIINAGWPGDWDAPERDAEFERHKRFTLGSALLGDGYYSLDASTAHGALWWEPEYDHDGRGKGYLGYPKGPAQRIGSTHGEEAIVNGSWTMVPLGWESQAFHAIGAYERDDRVAHSQPASARLTLEAVQPRGSLKMYQTVPVLGGYTYTLRFWAKADTPQTLLLHLYADHCPGSRCLNDRRFTVGTEWKLFETSFVATGNARAGLNFFISQVGSVWIDDVSMRGGDTTLYRRDFDNGTVLLNYTNQPQRVELGGPFRRLSIAGSPVWDGAVVRSEVVPPWDARILLRGRGIDPTPPLPGKAGGPSDGAALWPADPNPFRPGTALRFSLPTREPVRLVIYDVAGRLVRTLASGDERAAGVHSLRWEGDDDGGQAMPAGIYIARLQTPSAAQSRKLTLLP